jgi:hypothetical protein
MRGWHALVALLLAAVPVGHPLHLSTTRLDLGADGRTVEVQVRAFTDDLEEAIAAEGGVLRRFGGSGPTAVALDSALARHLRARLVIVADGAPLTLRYVGHERVDDAVEGYLEGTLPAPAAQLEITQRLLLDRFDDQQNLVFVVRGSARRSGLVRPGAATVTLAVP